MRELRTQASLLVGGADMNSTDKKMGVVFWVYEKWKFGEADEDSEFEFFADEKGARRYLKELFQKRRESNFFDAFINHPGCHIDSDEDGVWVYCDGDFAEYNYELYIEKFDVHPAEGGDDDDA